MSSRTPPRPGAQSIERAVRLVNLVAASHDHGLNLNQLVRASGLDRTTVWRMAQALQHQGLLTRNDQDGGYRLGMQATAWGAASLGHPELVRHCTPAMKRLARLSGDNVFLVLRLGDYSHCLHIEQGAHAVASFRQTVGETRLLGLGVASIAMLAALDDATVLDHHARRRPALATRRQRGRRPEHRRGARPPAAGPRGRTRRVDARAVAGVQASSGSRRPA